MKIKKRFLVNMISFGTMLFVIASSLAFTESQTNKLRKQEELAINIEREASELSYLSNDYLLYRESQQKSRWESKFSSLENNLHDLEPNSPEQERLVANIQENLQRLKEVFIDISSTFEKQGASANVALIQVPWSRMAVQSQGIIFDALRLAHIFESQASQFKRTNSLLILALLGMFSAYFFINYLLVYRRLLKSISDLQIGAKIVGSGNLNFSLADKTEDEIGELGQAFDKMTADLKDVTTSKTELEKEISERKKVEEALGQSEKKYRSLFNNMSEGFALIEPLKNAKNKIYDYRFLEVNASWEKILGLARKEIIGKTALEINPNLESYWIENFGQVANSGQSRHFENYIGRLDKWLEIRANPAENKMVAAIISDVTQRKKAEEGLKQNEKWLREVTGAAEAGRYGHATDFSSGFVSEKMAAIMGFKLSEIPQYPKFASWFADRIHPEDRPKFKETVNDYFQGKIARFDLEYRFKNKNNQWIWLHVITAPNEQDSNGRPLFSVGLVFDITENKKTEERLSAEKEFSENILEAIPDGMSIVDENAKIIHLNKSFQKTFGKDALGKKCYEIFKDDEKQCSLCPLRESIKVGETKNIEISGVAGGRTFSISHTGIIIDGKKHILEFFKDMTDYKAAEKSLKQSEEKYHNLYNSIRDGISLVDMKGQILECNQTFLNMLGYDEEEIKKVTFQEITPNKWRQMEDEIVEHRVLIRGYSGAYEKEYRRKDGTIFPVNIQIWLVRDEQGKPKGMWAMVNDITFRKKRDEELANLIKNLEDERRRREDLLMRIANERDVLDALMKNTKAQLAYMNKEFNFIAANAAYCRGSGKTEEELIGKNYFSFFPDKENELIFKKVIETAEPIEFAAKPFIFPDRSWIGVTYWDWTITPVKDATGQAFGLVVSMVDVTERIKNEKELSDYNRKLEQLAEDLEKFKLAVENVREHIIITDENGVILYSNTGAEQITGYSKAEVLGKKPSLWGGQMEKEFYEKFWHVIKIEKKPFIGEFINKRKNGQRYIANAMVIPILDSQDNIRFFVGVERDVTEEKELDRAKTEFISLAAHQLRTPIATISLTAEMLTRGLTGEVNPDTQKYLESIMEHVGKMTEMIETFLNISRIELGTFEIKPKPCNLLGTIEENIEGVMPLAQNKKIKIKKTLTANLPLLNIDPKIMRMVLENILSNAIKYTPENGAIEVAVSNQDQEIIIKISDNGIGIPENQQSQIFQKMFRADNVIDTKVEGVGLGLHLVKTLLEQSGGRIWFESKEKKGTTFYVALPLSGMKEKTRDTSQ